MVRRAEPETAEGAMKMKLKLLLLLMMMMMNGMAIDIAMIAMGMTLEKWLEGLSVSEWIFGDDGFSFAGLKSPKWLHWKPEKIIPYLEDHPS